jgi:hypothetical protein
VKLVGGASHPEYSAAMRGSMAAAATFQIGNLDHGQIGSPFLRKKVYPLAPAWLCSVVVLSEIYA